MTDVPENAGTILRVEDLSIAIRSQKGDITVVDHVNFTIGSSEIVALVGESGSGKSMTALSIVGLLQKGKVEITGGRLLFEGRDLRKLSTSEMREVRGRQISMIFQEPMNSLNPTMTIGDQVIEGLRFHFGVGKAEARRRAVELLNGVGIRDAEQRMHVYPHQLSGGMRQRVMIAIALICKPRLLIADEPTTALDVTTQAQILDLLAERSLQEQVSVLLITHDLGIVARYAQRVNVMYAGRIVEQASVGELFDDPLHPYTRGLLASVPRIDRDRDGPLDAIEGTPPTPDNLPPGCPFQERCELREEACSAPQRLREVSPGRAVACWKATPGEGLEGRGE